MALRRSRNASFGADTGFEDFHPAEELAQSQSREDKKAAAKERKRQRENAAATERRTSPGSKVRPRKGSVFQPAPPDEGPGGQARLFTPKQEPEAFETTPERRARTERIVQPRRTWAQMRPEGPGQGYSRADVEGLLGEQGVTTAGAKQRMREHARSALARAGGEMPRGQDFYSHEQAQRFEEDAHMFGVPYHVAVAVNAIMSPKTSLATPKGLQTNREAAHMVLRHVIAGNPGVPDTGGKGLSANADKAAELVRQHLSHGTHPLDAVDESGKHLLSGPKVEPYYSSYMHPGRAPTDIQHSRVLFGPGVRSEMTPEEIETKNKLIEQYGKDSPEVGRFIPKTPAEQLLARSGVHEWAHHVTEEVAKEFSMHPAEFQSVLWHEHKTQRGGRSAVQPEMQPLFAPRGNRPAGPTHTQEQLSNQFKQF